MINIQIVSWYAAALALLYIGLSARVISGRGLHRINLGSGGIDDMERRIRMHGNFAEYVPLTLLLLLMDELREMLSQSKSDEQTLLTEQLNNIKEIRSRDYFFVIAALLIGLVTRLISFYLFDRGIVRRIERLTENVRSWRSNENLKHPFSKKTDALGLLENELEELSGGGEFLITSP